MDDDLTVTVRALTWHARARGLDVLGLAKLILRMGMKVSRRGLTKDQVERLTTAVQRIPREQD